jgi:hypothetical protein
MLHGTKHVFQASTPTERESWIAAIKASSAEGKDAAEGIKGSEGYKEQHSLLSKPATVTPVAVAGATTSKEPETKKEEKAEAKEEKKEEKAARKSRSGSRKRNSIFENFGLRSKKDEQAEAKKEEKVETKEATPAESTATPVTAAPLDAPGAVVAAPVVEPAKTEVATPAPVETAKPATPANKRNSSIFGSLSSKFGQKKSVSEAKPSEAAPAVPVKDADIVEPVSAEAPVIPVPEASEPLAAAVASPATVPVTEVTNGVPETEEDKPEVKPETKSEPVQKRKSSLPFGLGLSKEKKDEVDGEKPKSSPFAKLRQTIKGKTSPKAAEKTPEKAPEKTEESASEPAVETPEVNTEAAETTAEPIISEPISAAPAAAPQVSATA